LPREGDVPFFLAELEFVEKCTARTMIEHFASHRDQLVEEPTLFMQSTL
jgi:hypothetical protein